MKVAVLLPSGAVGPHDQAALAAALGMAAHADVVALALVEAGASANKRQWAGLPVKTVVELPVLVAGGPAGADFRSLAEGLAATIERLEIDVAVVGHSEAPELELVPFALGARAEWATIPAVTHAKVSDRADALEVEARVGGVVRTLRVPLPVVLEVRAAASQQATRKSTKTPAGSADVALSVSADPDWLSGEASGSAERALGAKISLPARKSKKITGANAVVDACAAPGRR